MIHKLTGGRAALLFGAAFLVAAAPIFAPQLLAFPHKVDTPIGTVWSERELSADWLEAVANDTRARLATSPIAAPDETRPIFLTDGGWRWLWLANSSRHAFALTRPLTRAVVINRVDIDSMTVRNGQTVGGSRHLPAVIAHEFAHGMIRRHFGLLSATTIPTWKLEGYCDHVAGESSLSDRDVARLEASGTDHPALPYYHGRRRVEAILAANGGSVDELFRQGN